MPPPRSEADYDANVFMENVFLCYRNPNTKKRLSCPPSIQKIMYSIYMETKSIEAVSERIVPLFNNYRVTLVIVSALIRKVIKEIETLDYKTGEIRDHWTSVKDSVYEASSAEGTALASTAPVTTPYADQQQFSTGATRLGYPQSPFLNTSQFSAPQQSHCPLNPSPGLPQPTAQPNYPQAANMDPSLSRTAEPDLKRRAAHGLGSGSSDSRPSSSSSQSSRNHPPQGHARHGSTHKGSSEAKKPKAPEDPIKFALQQASKFDQRWVDACKENKASATMLVINFVKDLLRPSMDNLQGLSDYDYNRMRIELEESATYWLTRLDKDPKSGVVKGRSNEGVMRKLVEIQEAIRKDYEAMIDAPFETDDFDAAIVLKLNQPDPRLQGRPPLSIPPTLPQGTGGRPRAPPQMAQIPREEIPGQPGRRGARSTGHQQSTGQDKSSQSKKSSSGHKKRR